MVVKSTPDAALEMTIGELVLDADTVKCLHSARIKTVGDIMERERNGGLLKVRNIGKKRYLGICDALLHIGLLPNGSAAPPEPEAAPPHEEEIGQAVQIEVKPLKLKTAAFIDYEHWYIGLKDQHKRRPNIQAWFDDAKKRGNLVEVTFFGDFSEEGGMRDEINHIRLFTNRIIETKNTGAHFKKDFTDFILLDNVYQKVMASPEIEQIILFTGDGHFCSVASYLRNFCSKIVGIYGVDNAINSQLELTSDWCVRLPFDFEKNMECRDAILRNLKYAEDHTKTPMFMRTVSIVAEQYGLYRASCPWPSNNTGLLLPLWPLAAVIVGHRSSQISAPPC